MYDNSPIGVFDSGVGGLTVVKEIMKLLPKEQIIYFGDTARVPYGSKSKETITAYSRQIIRFLRTKKVKAIVIACNTASALALDVVSSEADIPIIDVVNPGAKTAAKTTRNGNIGVIATEATIRSDLYFKLLKTVNSAFNIYSKACPLFVPLVEEGWINDPVTKEVAGRYISELMDKDMDTLVLGCTHYPLLWDVIQGITGENVKLVNPAYETAHALHKVLIDQNLISTALTEEHFFYVSDGAEKFRTFANSILSCEMIETKEVILH